MSLTTCNECGAQISSEAVACPQCGLPLHKPRFSTSRTLRNRYLLLGVLAILALAAAGNFVYAERIFHETLRDAVASTTNRVTSLAQLTGSQNSPSPDRDAAFYVATEDINQKMEAVRAASGSTRRKAAAEPALLYMESARDFVRALDRCDQVVGDMASIIGEMKQYVARFRVMSYSEMKAAAPTFEPGINGLMSKLDALGTAEGTPGPERAVKLAADRLKESASVVRPAYPAETVVPDEILDATVRLNQMRIVNIATQEAMGVGLEAMALMAVMQAYQ